MTIVVVVAAAAVTKVMLRYSGSEKEKGLGVNGHRHRRGRHHRRNLRLVVRTVAATIVLRPQVPRSPMKEKKSNRPSGLQRPDLHASISRAKSRMKLVLVVKRRTVSGSWGTFPTFPPTVRVRRTIRRTPPPPMTTTKKNLQPK